MRARTFQWAAVPLVALGLAASLSACASSSSGTGPGTTAPGSSGTNFDTMSPAALQTAAQSEGQVNWYTTVSSDDVAPIIAAFNKQYPKIKVNALRLSASQLPP